MPVFALADAVLTILLGIVGIGFFWVVGSEIEKDVTAIGREVLKPITTNVPFMIAALIGIFLIVRGRK